MFGFRSQIEVVNEAILLRVVVAMVVTLPGIVVSALFVVDVPVDMVRLSQNFAVEVKQTDDCPVMVVVRHGNMRQQHRAGEKQGRYG